MTNHQYFLLLSAVCLAPYQPGIDNIIIGTIFGGVALYSLIKEK